MRPSFTMNNTPNGVDAQAVSSRKTVHALRLVKRCIFLTDGAHFLLSQFGKSMTFSEMHPPFLARVSQVVGLCAEEQMARIYARSVVAVMTDEVVWRNRAASKSPCDTMGEELMRFVAISPAPETKTAVPTTVPARRPRPTLIGSSDAHLAPKSKNVSRSQGRDGTILGSHDSLLLRDSWLERLATPQAVRFLNQCSRKAA